MECIIRMRRILAVKCVSTARTDVFLRPCATENVRANVIAFYRVHGAGNATRVRVPDIAGDLKPEIETLIKLHPRGTGHVQCSNRPLEREGGMRMRC